MRRKMLARCVVRQDGVGSWFGWAGLARISQAQELWPLGSVPGTGTSLPLRRRRPTLTTTNPRGQRSPNGSGMEAVDSVNVFCLVWHDPAILNHTKQQRPLSLEHVHGRVGLALVWTHWPDERESTREV